MSKKQFNVSIAAKIWVDVAVLAETLAEALIKGNEIKIDKVLKAAHNECNDYSTKITGVYAFEDWNK
jgi:hypothetical protein